MRSESQEASGAKADEADFGVKLTSESRGLWAGPCRAWAGSWGRGLKGAVLPGLAAGLLN